jgi:predicted RNase H-like HicB family nuclease
LGLKIKCTGYLFFIPYEKAAKQGQEVIDSYLEIYLEQGKALPQPKSSLQLLQTA